MKLHSPAITCLAKSVAASPEFATTAPAASPVIVRRQQFIELADGSGSDDRIDCRRRHE